ncbi:glutathionylspermidine synthase family protein [bacterium]|nr:glutathionylspermidine synthase family protein [bacterium]
MFDFRQALINAKNHPAQVRYEIDSYNYYLQQELQESGVTPFPLTKHIHGFYQVTGEKYDYFKSTSETLFKIFEKVVAQRHKDLNDGKDTFDFSEFQRRLIKVTPKSGRLIRHVRLDVIYSPSYKNLRVLECNPENPGGIWDNDFAVSCMARNQTKLYKELFTQNDDWSKINWHKQKQKCLHSIVDAYETQFGCKPKTIGVGVFAEDHEDFIAFVQANYFRKQGYNAVVVDPVKLQYRDGKVYDENGTQIDVIFRGFLMSEIAKHDPKELEALASAYENQDLCVVPPFSDALGNSKALIAEIPTKYKNLLTKKELTLLSEVFPNTMLLTDENYDEVMANLMDKVIKCSEGYGGYGVIVGRESMGKQLPTREEIRAIPWVVQDYYPHETIKCPYYKDGNVSIETVNIVLGNLIILGEYAGTLVRGSLTNVINTHQGAEILTNIDDDYLR